MKLFDLRSTPVTEQVLDILGSVLRPRPGPPIACTADFGDDPCQEPGVVP